MRLTVSLFLLLAGAAWAAEKDTCFSCHEVMEGMSQVFIDDIHYMNKLSCADCHGGDSKEEDQNLSMSASRGFKVRVTRTAVPDYCSECHADAAFIHKYAPQQRTDQVQRYRTSVHNAALTKGGKGAQCVDCHGVHTIRAVSDPKSETNPAHVTGTCAKCHSAAAAAFGKSPHAALFVNKEMAGCTTCHDGHATQSVSAAMLSGAKAVCAKCHQAGSAGAKAAADMAKVLSALETGARSGNAAAKQNLEKARAAVHAADPAGVRQFAAATKR